MAKLLPTPEDMGTPDPLNPPGNPPPQQLPLTWWNATRLVKAYKPTPNAIICPPSGSTFYEFGDPNGVLCLRQQTPTTPEEIPTEPLVPTITHEIIPVPAGAKLAETISELYSENLPDTVPWIYGIGLPDSNVPIDVKIRNRCINSELRLTLNVPPYLSIDVANTLVIPSQHTLTFTLSFNIAGAASYGRNTPHVLDENLTLTLEPLNTTTPIYVETATELGDVTLPPPITIPPPVIQLTDTLLPTPVTLNAVL